MQLQERRRQLGRQRPVHDSIDAARLRASRCEQDDRAGLQDRGHPHRQGLGRHLGRITAEERRVAAPRLGPEHDPVRARLQHARGLVEPDMTVRADAQHLQIDPPHVGNLLLVTRTLRVRIRRAAVEEVRVPGRDVDTAEQVALHEAAVASGVRRWNPEELVEIERRDLGEVGVSVGVERCQLVVERHRRLARWKPQHETRLCVHRGRNTPRERSRRGPIARKHRHARAVNRTEQRLVRQIDHQSSL